MVTAIMSFAIGAGLMALIILVCDIFLEPDNKNKRPKAPFSRRDYPGDEHFFVMFCAIKYYEYVTGSLTSALEKVVDKMHAEGRAALQQYNVYSAYPTLADTDMRFLRKCIVLNDAHRWEMIHESNRVYQRKVAMLMDVYFGRMDDIPDFENHQFTEIDEALMGNQWDESLRAVWSDIKRVEKSRALRSVSSLKPDSRDMIKATLRAYEVTLEEDHLYDPSIKDRFDLLLADIAGWDRLAPRHQSRNMARFFVKLRDRQISLI